MKTCCQKTCLKKLLLLIESSDGVVNSGRLENVKVDKEMMKYVDKAHSQYLHNLKTKKIKLLLQKRRQRKES